MSGRLLYDCSGFGTQDECRPAHREVHRHLGVEPIQAEHQHLEIVTPITGEPVVSLRQGIIAVRGEGRILSTLPKPGSMENTRIPLGGVDKGLHEDRTVIVAVDSFLCHRGHRHARRPEGQILHPYSGKHQKRVLFSTWCSRRSRSRLLQPTRLSRSGSCREAVSNSRQPRRWPSRSTINHRRDGNNPRGDGGYQGVPVRLSSDCPRPVATAAPG